MEGFASFKKKNAFTKVIIIKIIIKIIIITGPNVFFRPLIHTRVNLFSTDNTGTGNYKTSSKCLRLTDWSESYTVILI